MYTEIDIDEVLLQHWEDKVGITKLSNHYSIYLYICGELDKTVVVDGNYMEALEVAKDYRRAIYKEIKVLHITDITYSIE